MDKERQFQIFRAFVKQVIREKGVKTGYRNFGREANSEVKNMNETLGLTPPLGVDEFMEIYLELTQEIAKEHFEMVSRKLQEVRKPTHAQ